MKTQLTLKEHVISTVQVLLIVAAIVVIAIRLF